MGFEVAPTSLAPGFRFHPTDEELVRYYLRRKACGLSFRFQAVTEIDVYKSEPWELAGYSSLKTRDLEWYFFSPVDRKYGNGSRLNRATGQGYWKATGKDRPVRHKSQTIGMKKTLVFHSGRAPDGKRTNWVMHEYRLCDSELQSAGVSQDAFVLCRIFQKSGLGPPNGDRYAPFVDEEWDEDAAVMVPGADADDDVANGDDEHVACTDLDQRVALMHLEEPVLDKMVQPTVMEDSGEVGMFSQTQETQSLVSENGVQDVDQDMVMTPHRSKRKRDTLNQASVTAPFKPPSVVNKNKKAFTFDDMALEESNESKSAKSLRNKKAVGFEEMTPQHEVAPTTPLFVSSPAMLQQILQGKNFGAANQTQGPINIFGSSISIKVASRSSSSKDATRKGKSKKSDLEGRVV